MSPFPVSTPNLSSSDRSRILAQKTQYNNVKMAISLSKKTQTPNLSNGATNFETLLDIKKGKSYCNSNNNNPECDWLKFTGANSQSANTKNPKHNVLQKIISSTIPTSSDTIYIYDGSSGTTVNNTSIIIDPNNILFGSKCRNAEPWVNNVTLINKTGSTLKQNAPNGYNNILHNFSMRESFNKQKDPPLNQPLNYGRRIGKELIPDTYYDGITKFPVKSRDDIQRCKCKLAACKSIACKLAACKSAACQIVPNKATL